MINLINAIAKWDYYIIYMNRRYCYHWFSNPLLQMFYILFNKFKLISTVFQHNDLHLKHIHVLVFLSNTYPKQKIKLFSFYYVCNNWYTNACNKIIVTIFIYVQIFVINGCKHNITCNLEIFYVDRSQAKSLLSKVEPPEPSSSYATVNIFSYNNHYYLYNTMNHQHCQHNNEPPIVPLVKQRFTTLPPTQRITESSTSKTKINLSLIALQLKQCITNSSNRNPQI